jgi:hypothetical protein
MCSVGDEESPRDMPTFSVLFSRSFRYTVEADNADAAVERITTAYRSIDYNLQLPLASKIEDAAGDGVEFVDFFGHVVLEEEIVDEEEE